MDRRVSDIITATQQLNSSDIRLLLKKVPKADWGEEQVLQDLLTKLSEAKEFSISAFRHPHFFINHNVEVGNYRPEIIILDWDLGGGNTADYLLELLEFSFSLICIYTGVDLAHDIDKLIGEPKFIKYRNRIKIIRKGEENSVHQLFDYITEENKRNFSFRFGKDLRTQALNATETILIELGKSTNNQIANYFAFDDDSTFDLTDFLAERFRNYLTDIEFELPKKEDRQPGPIEAVEKEIAAEFWSNRIYFYGKNPKYVKRGDILMNKEKKKYFLVVNADCDLNRFWHKNSGVINLIPLHLFEPGNTGLKEKLLTTRKAKKMIDAKVTSLTGSISNADEDHFILPFVRVMTEADRNKFVLRDFWGIPKEIFFYRIKPPAGQTQEQLKDLHLTYDDIRPLVRVATMSEPFITPLIQKILGAIAGFGVPDYQIAVQTALSDKMKEMFS
jgi:hypothetical protein